MITSKYQSWSQLVGKIAGERYIKIDLFAQGAKSEIYFMLEQELTVSIDLFFLCGYIRIEKYNMLW